MIQFAIGIAVSLALNALGGATYAQSPSSNSQAAKQSAGLRVPIQSIAKRDSQIIVQILLENTTKNRLYVVLYGSGRASLDNGHVGILSSVTGVNTCIIDQLSDVNGLEACRKQVGAGTDGYTYIEPGEFQAATLEYAFGSGTKEALIVNFSVLGLLRAAPPTDDPLRPTTPGPPQVVTVNFPLTPFER